MPTPLEIEKLAGETPAPEASAQEKPLVSDEDYQKAIEQKDEALKFANRRDTEIHTLRKQVKDLQEKAELTPRKEELPVDSDTEQLRATLESMGYAPREEVEKDVEKRVQIMNRATQLKSDMEAAVVKYPFVDPKTLLDFMSDKGTITVDQAIMLKYSKELSATNPFPEPGTSQRTLSTQPGRYSDGQDIPAPFISNQKNNGQKFRGFVAKALDKASQSFAGN